MATKTGSDVSYVTTSGECSSNNPMFMIHDYLLSQQHSQISFQRFKQDLRIDLADPRNHDLLSLLRTKKHVQIDTEEAGQEFIRTVHPLGVTDEAALSTLFTVDLPRGDIKTENGHTALAVSEQQLVDAFPGIGVAIDELISRDVITEFNFSNAPTRKKGHQPRVFFPTPNGIQAPSDLCSLFHGVALPDDVAVRNELIKQNKRTEADYEERKKRRMTLMQEEKKSK